MYLWNASDGNTEQLLDLGEEQTVTSVAWSGNGKYLAVGDSSATIQLWDVQKHKRIRAMKGHHDRVGALAWNRHTLARWVWCDRVGALAWNRHTHKVGMG